MNVNALEQHTIRHIKSYERFSLGLIFIGVVLFFYQIYELFFVGISLEEAIIRNILIGMCTFVLFCGVFTFHLIGIIEKFKQND